MSKESLIQLKQDQELQEILSGEITSKKETGNVNDEDVRFGQEGSSIKDKVEGESESPLVEPEEAEPAMPLVNPDASKPLNPLTEPHDLENDED